MPLSGLSKGRTGQEATHEIRRHITHDQLAAGLHESKTFVTIDVLTKIWCCFASDHALTGRQLGSTEWNSGIRLVNPRRYSCRVRRGRGRSSQDQDDTAPGPETQQGIV